MRALAIVLLAACTSTTSIRHAGHEIGERGTLRLRNGEQHEVTFVGHAPGGILVEGGGQRWQVGYEYLDALELESHGGGAWQGVKYGALAGALTGIAWGIGVSAEGDNDFSDEPELAISLGAVMFGAIGVMFGAPIGAIKGETTRYRVDPP